MPYATRSGDVSSGHNICAPTELVTASGNVFINNKGAGRLGDRYASHSCPIHPPHQDVISEGSTTVFINGISVARIGDSLSVAGSVATGSGNVKIGD